MPAARASLSYPEAASRLSSPAAAAARFWRAVVSAALEAAHVRVRVAWSAAEARQRLAEHTPAIVIVDLGMPVEDGFSLIRGRQSHARRVPAIVLSAYADTASHKAALAASFDAFLPKPTRAETLVELVFERQVRARPDPSPLQ